MFWKRPHRSRLASATRLTIRRHVPWPVRLLSLVLAGALGAGLALAGWRAWFGQEAREMSVLRADAGELRSEVSDLRERLAAVESERARLALIANSADSQVKVEQSATERLTGQLRVLEAENGKLQADLTYLESLLPAPEVIGDGAVVIRRLVVEAGDSPNQLYFRALLAQGGRAEREFSGSFQFVVATDAQGRHGTYVWPASDSDGRRRTRLAFKRFQRLEGSFEVPPGVTIRTVQLQVIERGTVRAQATTTP